MNLLPLIIIMLIVLCETFAIACVKEYHNTSCIKYFVLGILGYTVVCYLLHQSFYHNGMAITNILWSGLSVLIVALTGILIFKEKIHFHDIIAGLLIAAGVIIIKVTD